MEEQLGLVPLAFAQRLLRTLCDQCKRAYEPEASQLAALGLKEDSLKGKSLYEPVGCSACEYTGFRGRTGIFELMEIDWMIRDMTFQKKPTMAIRNQAVRSGMMIPLIQDGIRKILAGRTTIQEVLKAAKSTEEMEARDEGLKNNE